MIGQLVAWVLKSRLIVTLAVLALIAVGTHSYLTLPVDAVPDITNVQVQVLTNAPGLSPLEVESLVTRPVELSLTGLPGAAKLRSISRAGVSQVTVVFRDDVALASARALVSQRLPAARESIPAAASRPEMGPLTSGLGEVYHFTMRWAGHSARDLRTLLEWDIARDLRTVPGVVEVNPWGAAARQIEVRLRSSDLQAQGVTQLQVEQALLAGGENAGGGSLERGEEQVLVRLDGQYRTLQAVESQVVATGKFGVPILVKDVANVVDGEGYRSSAASADGAETVYAMVQMVAGGNASELMGRVKARLAEIEKRLPKGATIQPFYDRAALVDRVLGTVRHSLLEGGAIVVLVLLVFLGDLGAGLVVATTIPLAMLGAFALMRACEMTGNLMSLGAIDFGLVVDGAVVIVEGALATMAARGVKASTALGLEASAVGRPIAFGVLIIGIVYVPILLLEGVEAKMFAPMAWTVLFALATALVLSFTWVPALASIVLRRAHTGDVWLIRQLRRLYEPTLDCFLRRSRAAAIFAVASALVGVAVAIFLGAEFVPRLEEGDLVVQVTRPPSVSVAEALRGTTEIERTLKRFPEVRRVISRSGSPDVATDVMGIEQSDVFVMLAPREDWQSAPDREALIALFDRQLRTALPGTGFSWTQPIEMRSQELLGGLKSDVGVKVYGDDLPTLTRLASELSQLLASVPGAADVRVEPTSGLPLLTVVPAPEKMGRLGIRTDEVRAAVQAIKTGRIVGSLAEGDRRFPVAVRMDAPPSSAVVALARTPVTFSMGRTLPLGDLCEIGSQEGPAQISREQGRRRILIEANVRQRDLGSFVQELQQRVAKLQLPAGYYVEYAGQYENLVHAAIRLAIIVPLTLGVIFVLLFLTFGEAGPALLIFMNIPVAASGGLVALASRGLPLSISAAVGFIALFGVATLNGVVLLSAARRLEDEGLSSLDAARRAAHERLRPVLTTAVVASLGFLPMALATSTGAEVQRPLATVVIGGLTTATALTLLVLPSLFARTRRLRQSNLAPAGSAAQEG
ncbi:MAG TPA: CusA/CzcA family heavy metal efflux RND transporter [Polyangiaceae bacterium]|nr:CusA/CzcA family heavy metal efflux RND transporter [Polyangiaceae bacterium]